MMKLIGITHDTEGQAIRRVPRAVKVSIGHRQGKAIHAYIDAEGKWKVEVGAKDPKITAFPNREEAETFYREQYKTAPTRDYPQKLPYMTFCRIAGDGESLVTDFDAVEAHGPMPTEIPIIFTDPQPADGAYQYWKSRGLMCSGDGITAQCKTELAGLDPAAAAEAKKNNQEFYQPSKCWLTGCAEVGGRNCKPHGRLAFQLVRQPKIGQKAELATTSPKSIAQIFSALEELGGIVRRFNPSASIVGIPLILSVRAWKHATPEGKTGKSYAFGLEFRPADMAGLRKELEGHIRDWSNQLTGSATKRLNAPIQEEQTDDPFEDDDGVTAAAMTAEFHPGVKDDETAEQPAAQDGEPAPQPNASSLRDRLRRSRKAATATEEPEPKPEPSATTVETKAEPADPDPEPEQEPEKKQTNPEPEKPTVSTASAGGKRPLF